MPDPQTPDKVIDIPGVGSIAFPGTMKPEEIEAAAAKLYKDANPSHPPVSDKHSWLSTAADWLPTIEGAAGGLIGGAAGLAGGGIGAIPGAMAGAALGGAAGEAQKQVINRLAGEPAPATVGGAAKDIALAGGSQAGAELVGGAVGAAAAPILKAGGERLMQSAVKPAYAAVKNQVRRAELPRVVKTLLDEGINVTNGGLRKINDLLEATNDQINNLITNRGAVYPEAVAARGDDVAARLAQQAAPLDDLAANRKVVDQFMEVHGGAPNLPAKPLTLRQAQDLKTGTYRAIGNRAYGEARGAQTETEKALARGLKEDIETELMRQGKNIKPLNAREGRLMDAKEAIAKRVAAAGNRDPGGLGWIAENPRSFLAFVIARSPAVKSLLARGLYQSAGKAARVPPQLIRLGMAALAQDADEDTTP